MFSLAPKKREGWYYPTVSKRQRFLLPDEANVSDIDQKISQIQQSTRTSFGVLLPLHERMRMRFRWYYNWHLKRSSKWVHLGFLALYILALGAFGFTSYKTAIPTQVQAATNTTTWTIAGAGNSDFNGEYTYGGLDGYGLDYWVLNKNSANHYLYYDAGGAIMLSLALNDMMQDSAYYVMDYTLSNSCSWNVGDGTGGTAPAPSSTTLGGSPGADLVATGAGDAGANGNYTYGGYYYGLPFYAGPNGFYISFTGAGLYTVSTALGSIYYDLFGTSPVGAYGWEGGMAPEPGPTVAEQASSITISGTAKQYDESTNAADSETVKVAINGDLQAQTGTTSGGIWSITGVTAPASGDTVTVFIDGVADGLEANAVTKYDGTGDITGINLFEKHLSLGSEDNQTLSNNDISKYDNSVSSDEDIFFDVDDSNNLTLPAAATQTDADQKLITKASNTYRPASAGGVRSTVPILTIPTSATVTLDSNTLELSGVGTPLSIVGTFNVNTSTIEYSGATATNVVAITYNNLYIDQAGVTFTAAGDFTVSSVLTINAGTFDASSRTITLSGSGTPFVVTGTFTKSTSTIKYTGSSATNVAAAAYTNLYFDYSGTTFSAAGTISVSGTLTTTAGSIYNNNGCTLTVGTLSNLGKVQFQGGETITITTKDTTHGTIEYNGTGNYSGIDLIYGTAYYNLTFNGSGGQWLQSQTASVGGDLHITAGTFNQGGNNRLLTVTGTMYVDGGAYFSANLGSFYDKIQAGALTISSGAYALGQFARVVVTGAFTMSGGTHTNWGYNTTTVGGNCDMSGGTSTSIGTLTLNGNSASFTPNSGNYGTVNASKTAGQTLTLAGSFTASGFYVNSGSINAGTTRVTIVNSATAGLNTNGQTLYDLTLSGTGPAVTGNSVVSHNVTFSGSNNYINNGITLTVQSSATTTIDSGKKVAGAGTLVLVDGAGANLTNSGTLAATARFQTSTSDVTVPAGTYGRIQAYNASASNHSVILGTAGSQTINIAGNTPQNINGYLLITNDGAGNLTLDGNTYNPTVNVSSRPADTTDKGKIYFSGSGGGTKTLSAGSGTWTVKGDVDFTGGLLTAGNSTFNLNGSVGGQTVTSNSQSFKNLTIANTHANGATFADAATTTGTFADTTGSTKITFLSGATYNFNTINIAGAADHLITLAPSGATNWIINPTNVTAVSYVTVSKSTNSGTSICATYSTDGGDNIGWKIGGGSTCNFAISGTITKDGSGLGGVLVSAVKGATTKTDTTEADGTFSVADCEDGTWTLTPTKTNYTFSPGTKDAVVSGANVTGQDFTATFVSPSFLAGWSYRSLITIDHSKVGSGGVTDFPVIITEANVPADFWTQVASDGKDIRITSEDGATVLKNEIAGVDTSGHKLEAWFKAPSLSDTYDSTFYLYWGNSSAEMPSAADQQAVWSNGYAGVWHLGESSGNALDSTSNAIAGSVQSGVTQGSTGKIGKDYAFNGSGYVDLGNPSTLPNGTSAKTMCAWGKTTTTALAYRWIAAYGTASNGGSLFIGLYGTALYGGGFGDGLSSSNYWSAGNWGYSCITYSGTQAALYGNGNALVSPTNKSWSLNRSVAYFGRQTNNAEYWNGEADEIRISSVARSAPWISTEYNNQDAPGTFYSASAEEASKPNAPIDVAISGLDSTYFDVTWTDNSSDETGFKVYVSTTPNATCSAATYPGTPDYTTAADVETQHVTGKSINSQYCAKVIAYNDNGDSDPAYAAAAKYTLANTPSAPTVAGDYSVADGYYELVTNNPNNNPAGTQYWLQYSTNGTDFSNPAGMTWFDFTPYYKLAGLNPNTQYWFKVKAKNGDGTETSYSTAGADVTPPAAPLNLNTSNICATTASTSWGAATGADKYTFSYGTDVDATNLGTTGNLTDTSHNLASLTDGETYYWKVSATSDANGTGAYSAIEDFTASACEAPIAPSDFNGSAASATQINWTWGNTAGETGWKVQDTDHTTLVTLPADTLSWNETPLSVNTAYTRHVNVYNDYGANDSNQKTVYTLANVPSAPTVSAVASGIKIVVNKNSNPEADTRYAIYNQTESKYVKHADGTLQADPDWQLYADWGGASGFINTGLLPNITNSYQVKAENGDDIATALSDASSAYTFANVPSAPTVNTTSTTSLTVIINQNSNPAGTNFAIRETATSKYVQADGTLGASAVWQDYTTWGGAAGIVVTGLSPNGPSTFEVKAKNGDSVETSMSGTASKYTLANIPSAPTVSTVSSSVIKIVINQNSNPAGTSYAIYNQTASKYVKSSDGTLQNDPDWQTYATWGGAGGFNNTGLDAGTSYSYQIKAENGDAVTTIFSDAASTNTSYPTVGFSSSTDSASISHAANTVAINLSGVSGTDASVDYAVTGGTAVSGVDYTFVDGTANISHGQTGVNVNLTLINDHLVGANKTIVFTLSNPVNTTLGATDTLTFTIINDNPAPSGSFTINGGATKTNNRTLTLALTYSLATQVIISTDPAFGGAAYEAIAASKSYTLPDADATYTVYIKLKDQYGNESGSYSNNITLDRVAPSAPSNLAAQGGNRTISLSWTNPIEADFTYVRVYRGLAAGFDIAHADKTFDVYKPGATYVDSDVINNKEYYYKVTAFDDIGNESAASAEVNARADSDNPTTPGKPSISQPTKEYNGKTYTTEKGIDFSWTASTDVNSGLEGYYLTIATTSGGNNVLNAQQIAPAQTSYHYDFASDGIYFVRVYAKDNKGNRSADSDEYIFYIDKSAPSDPSDVLMYDASDRSNGTYTVALSWKSSTDDVSGLKGYVVLRDGTALNLNADNMTQNIVSDEDSGNSFYLDILSADAKASYSIKAVDNASNETSAQDARLAATNLTSTTGQSAGSTQIELPATVIGEGKLDITDVKVTPSEVVSDKTQAKVTWKTGVPATSQVMYGTSTSYDLKTELDTGLNSTHTVILSDLNPSATYHFKVVSKDKNGKELSSSDQTFSTGGKAKDKSILEIITGTLSDAFTRMWNSISGFFTTGASAADNMAAIDTLSVVDISTDEQPGFAIFWPQNMGTVSVERESGGGFETIGTTDQNFYLDLTIKEKGNYSYRVGGQTAAAADELSGKSTISDIKITAGAVDKKEASVIVSYKTDKLAKGQVSYGEGSPSNQSQPEDGLNQSHVILIEKLKPSTTYTFTLKATDKSGSQITTSSAQNYTTPASPRDTTVLEIIIKALQNAFSGFDQFMKK